MKKLIGFFICVCICTVLGLGSTGCTKKTETTVKDKKTTVEKKTTEEKKTTDGTTTEKKVEEKKIIEEKKGTTDGAKKTTDGTTTEKKVEEKKVEEKKTTEEKKSTKAGDAHEGTFVSASGKTFKMKHKGEEKDHEHTLAANAKVTNDGKDAKLEELKAGQRIRVTTAADDVKTATRVEALEKNKDF